MPILSRILGWTPPDNEDYLDVALSSSPLLPLQNPTFHISEPNPIRRAPPRRVASRAHFQANSPASSNSALSSSDGENEHDPDHDAEHESSSNGKRVDGHGKHADPSWVARPRNEFILFRCDYVRKHSREGKRVRRAPGAEAEKTLSKQAAEAWHHLPPEERLYWKDRANGERNEHARRYPDYRYRPKKSAAGRKRQTRTSPSKPLPISNVNTSADTTPGGNMVESSGRPTDPAPESIKSASPALTPDAAALAGGSKTRPRRSCSVPQLKNNAEPMNRRLRSTASHGWLTSSSNVQYSGTHPTRLSSEFATSGSNTPQSRLVSHPTPTTASSSSSLLNWNGQRMVAAIPQPTQFLSSTAVSFAGGGGRGMDITGPLLTEFTTGGNPIAPSQMFNNSEVTTHPLSLSHAGAPHPYASSSSTQHPHHPHYTAEGDIWLPQLHPTTNGYPGDDLDIDIDLAGSHSSSGVGSAVNGPGALTVGAPRVGLGVFDASSVGALGSLSHLGSNMVEYGAGTTGTVGGHPSSSPETLFAMDTEDLFANLNY